MNLPYSFNPAARNAILWVGVVLASACLSCSSDTEVHSSPREYKWSVSTIADKDGGQIELTSIWGSSPAHVFVSGRVSWGPPIFQFNGFGWVGVPLPSQDYGEMHEIIGFSPTDIWAAGNKLYFGTSIVDKAAVLRFDGTTWKDALPSDMGARRLWGLWGTSSSNIWCGSADGKLLHYDGSQWTLDTLYLGLWISTIGGDANLQYAFGNTTRGALDDSVMWFSKINGKWTLEYLQYQDGFSANPHFGLQCAYTPAPGVYYSGSFNNVMRFAGTEWQRVLRVVGAEFVGLGGTGPDNIFAVGAYQGRPVVYHWNGQDWSEISSVTASLPDNTIMTGVWCSGNDAFIVGTDHWKSYVVHGR